MTHVVGPWGFSYTGPRALLFRTGLSTRKGKKGLRWITFDVIMMSCVAVAHIKKDSRQDKRSYSALASQIRGAMVLN